MNFQLIKLIPNKLIYREQILSLLDYQLLYLRTTIIYNRNHSLLWVSCVLHFLIRKLEINEDELDIGSDMNS